jgi:hypothetical protein
MHFEQGGDGAQAIHYFDRAAVHAERRFAYRESAAYLRSALAHQDELVTRDGRMAAQAIPLLLRLGSLSALVAGYSAAETEDAFERARALAADGGEPRGLFFAEMALCRLHLARAEITRACGHSDRMLALARSDAPELTAFACCWAGFAASSLGELSRARALLEEGSAAPLAPGIIRHHDVHRMIGSQLALVLDVIGDPDGARAVGDAALARSVAANRTADLAFALVEAAERAAFVRDRSAGAAHAARAVAVCDEGEIASFALLARFYQAALDERDTATARLAVMRRSLGARHALGDRFQDSVLLALMAELEIEIGDHAGAESTLAEADAYVAASAERHYASELLRLRGVLAVARGGADAASTAAARFRSAIECARACSAALWELRSTHALVELPLPRAERAAARSQLAAIVGRFPATPAGTDVRAARLALASR